MTTKPGFRGGRDPAAITENVELLTGQRGNGLDRALTLRELERLGLANLKRLGRGGAIVAQPKPELIAGSGGGSSAQPPGQPLNLQANGAFHNILLSWDKPNYSGHAYTEIWRATDDNLANAALVGTTNAPIYADATGQAFSGWYWVRFVNTDNKPGAFSGPGGVAAATATDADYLLNELAGQISESQLTQALTGRLDDHDAKPDTYSQAAAPTNPKVGDYWHNTTTQTVSRYNGTVWVVQANGYTATSQLDDDANLGQTANWDNVTGAGKPADNATQNQLFYQAETPAGAFGDIWIDTDDNQVYLHDGVGWVAGKSGQGQVKGISFLRAASAPATPTGGTFTAPTADGWSDGVPADDGNPLWMTSRLFTSDGAAPQQGVWSAPAKIGQHGTGSKVQFSVDGLSDWHDIPATEDQYLRTGTSTDGGLSWSYDGATKIKGEQGEPGTAATERYTWLKYADSPSSGMSDDPTNKSYIGIAYNQTSVTESTDYGDYSWSFIDSYEGAINQDITVAAQQVLAIAGKLQDQLGQEATALKPNTYSQATEPAGGKEGDLWYDTDNEVLKRHNGTTWVLHTTGWAHVSGEGKPADNATVGATWGVDINGQPAALIQTFYQDTAPVSGMSVGDFWIDSDDDKTYRWNGSSWLIVQDSDILLAINNAATAQATADGKVVTFAQASTPTAEGEGDLWIDTDDGNKLYRWNGTAWVAADDTRLAQALTDAANAQATADGKIQTFYQATAPASDMSVGDLWVDTDDGNKLHRYSGSSWLAIQDSAITQAQQDASQAIVDASTAQATADGKVVTFVQPTPPTAEGVGDLWLDSDDNHHLYRWNGTSWASLLQDAASWDKVIGAGKPADGATVNHTFAQDEAPTSGMVTGDFWIDTNDGNRIRRYNGTSWVDVRDAGAQGHMDIWGLKNDAGDITVGIGLLDDGQGNTEVAVAAGKFYVFDPAVPATKDTLFVVQGGTVYMNTAYMDQAFIKNLAAGEITADKINALILNAVQITGGTLDIGDNFSVDAAGNLAAINMQAENATLTGTLSVPNASITNAAIADGAITNAKIGNAQVDTLQLAGQAVTLPVSAFTAGTANHVTNGTWYTVQTLVVTHTGASIYIQFGAGIYLNWSPPSPSSLYVRCRLVRDSNVLVDCSAGTGRTYSSDGVLELDDSFSFGFSDTPAAGTYTYTLQVRGNGSNSGINVAYSNRSLFCIETKR